MDDFGRLDTLIKLLKSCIFYQNANRNILLLQDTSCWSTICEEMLKCYKIVTLDPSAQNASITILLRESVVGFSRPVFSGAQSPKSIFGDFFLCAFSLAPNGGRAGTPSGVPVPEFRSTNPVRSTTRLVAGMAGNKCNSGVQPC